MALRSTAEVLVIEYDQVKFVKLLSQGSKSFFSTRKHIRVSIAKAPLANFLKTAFDEANQAQCKPKKASGEAKQAQCEPTLAFGKAKLPVAPLARLARLFNSLLQPQVRLIRCPTTLFQLPEKLREPRFLSMLSKPLVRLKRCSTLSLKPLVRLQYCSVLSIKPIRLKHYLTVLR